MDIISLPQWSDKTFIYLRLYMFLPNLSAQAGCDTGSIFKVEFNKFKFRIFFLLD